MNGVPSQPTRLRVIDSHTAGEPTRVIVNGAPALPGTTMAEKREALRTQADWLRTASVLEPRGHEAMVGALLLESSLPDCVAGVVFFNNSGYLNGCLHGTMGLAATLSHLGQVGAGRHKIETPVGVVTIEIGQDGQISVSNVRCYRSAKDVALKVEGYGLVTGDIAWGGNWFFLTTAPPAIAVDPANLSHLTSFGKAVRRALDDHEITGDDGGEIDHIEIFGPPNPATKADSKNFVLCPGNAYDRSPCGTGTSAKLACLYDDGVLAAGALWHQAGILDSIFVGSVTPHPDGGVMPTVSGSAHITAEADLLIDPAEPFSLGIPSFLS